ncbi:MAG: HEAT repeat domain-containing protein [Deltaproteobacteria bacterium]|nr:HEAT repeat domain-containing protein [Deltaproteobacteria bacterium]
MIFCFLSLSLFVSFLLPFALFADAKSDYLVRLLEGSSQFRVRAQAAISLGRVKNEPSVLKALLAALSDQHPAVRAASATSLERIGDPSALNELEQRRDDPEPAVRSAVSRAIAVLQKRAERDKTDNSTTAAPTRPSLGPLRFYVGVGVPATKNNTISKDLLVRAQKFIVEQVSAVEGVLVAPINENPQRAKAVIEKQKLMGFFLDSSVVQLEKQQGGGTRAVVSVIVGTYPGRDMRSILQGSATVMGEGPGTEVQAIEGAFRGALRRLSQALAISGN